MFFLKVDTCTLFYTNSMDVYEYLHVTRTIGVNTRFPPPAPGAGIHQWPAGPEVDEYHFPLS